MLKAAVDEDTQESHHQGGESSFEDVEATGRDVGGFRQDAVGDVEDQGAEIPVVEQGF